MYTLITFATQWGSKHGGINSFNADFLTAFGVAYHQNVQTTCIVTETSPEALEEASRSHITLVPLSYPPVAKHFDSSIGESGVDLVTKFGIKFDPNKTIWLGHDLITGEAAIAAAKTAGGRSAVIHHMSYSDYESYAEDSLSALTKTQRQTAVLEKADLVLAIGPLLRDAAIDRLGASKPVRMLIPGLPEIDPQEPPKTFVAFLSGRLSADAARIKQGHLGIAAFAKAEQEARINGVPNALRRQPKLILRGIDFEDSFSKLSPSDVETDLKKFAEKHGGAVINLHALPYTEYRQQLYRELSRSTVALMPSWHEGFGLVAWEAIAAGVPVIIGQNSGVYRYLEEAYPGTETGYVQSVDIKGKIDFPHFREDDIDATVSAIRVIAADTAKARKKASSLRNLLLEKNTWVACCEEVVATFEWDLQRGSVSDRSSAIVQQITRPTNPFTPAADAEAELLRVPKKQWRPGTGMADSQLLRAEEALLPFEPGRENDVEKLREWINDPTWPITVRLITGAGGQGKTRLAIQVCELVRTLGWYSGFLDTNLDLSGMKSLWADLRLRKQPLLIVVDYAETRQATFLTLLKLTLQNSMNQPVRMLLLARDSGEWWDNLPGKDPDCEALLIGNATTGPFPLAPLYTTQQQRQDGFVKALEAFANVLDVNPPDLKLDLAGDQFERPLFIQMGALLALYGESPVTSQGVTKALLNHERRYWVRLLEPLNLHDAGRWAEQVLALATLAGGFPTAKIAETLWSGAKGNVLSTSEFNSLFRSMTMLYPGTQGLQALRPDLLGEALVAQALLRPGGDKLLDTVLGRSALQSTRRHALTVLSRLSNERVDVDEVLIASLSRLFPSCGAEVVAVSVETVSRLPELAGQAFEQIAPATKGQLVGSLIKSLPDKSVQLAALNCLVFSYQAERAAERLVKRPNSVDRMYDSAWTLDRYSTSLAQIGDYSRSCEIAKESVNLFRRLVGKDPNRFGAIYAGSLTNYSLELSKNGFSEEATNTAHEALKTYERFTKQNVQASDQDYATLLDNYAIRLRQTGQREEALLHSEKALEIRKRLALKTPDRFEPDYARSLMNHSGNLSDAGKHQEALLCAQQALEIRRRLVLRNPDRFEPEFALSLANHALHLGNVGQYEKALADVKKALEIYQRLFLRIPKAFALNFLSNSGVLSFLNWLCENDSVEISDNLQASAFSLVPVHDQNVIRLISEFVQGCRAPDLSTRRGHLVSVISIWPDLSRGDRRIAASDRLCAAAWCAKFAQVVDDSWQEDWQRYWTERSGNVPSWMFEVARRLDFQFPEIAR